MLTTMSFLISITSLVLLFILFIKYKKLKKYAINICDSKEYKELKNKYDTLYGTHSKIVEGLKKHPLRQGYFETKLTTIEKDNKKPISFSPLIYVEELDRYTNGTCERQITKIIPKISSTEVSHDTVIKYVKDNFSPIHKISDITWLESETEIKELRKHKMENIFKNIDNDNTNEQIS